MKKVWGRVATTGRGGRKKERVCINLRALIGAHNWVMAEVAKATLWARFALSPGRRCGSGKEMRLAAFRSQFQGLAAIKKKW